LSRGPEREIQRNLEPMPLTDRLMPSFATIVGFRNDNRLARVCARIIVG
jgi:hypothetical protein